MLKYFKGTGHYKGWEPLLQNIQKFDIFGLFCSIETSSMKIRLLLLNPTRQRLDSINLIIPELNFLP